MTRCHGLLDYIRYSSQWRCHGLLDYMHYSSQWRCHGLLDYITLTTVTYVI
jgi:hypothetical protein